MAQAIKEYYGKKQTTTKRMLWNGSLKNVSRQKFYFSVTFLSKVTLLGKGCN